MSKLPHLYHLPLENYKSRYTELMSGEKGWTAKHLGKHFNLTRIEPPEDTHSVVIQNGRVLDSVNRPIWALEQIKLLLRQEGGSVFLEDFFHPGVESLPYSGKNFKLYSYCWAQTFDRYDFTRDMVNWMRAYEAMMLAIARKTFVASPLLQELILCAFPSLSPQDVPVVGLPFDSSNVRSIYDPEMQPEPIDVVFSSRFDREKQPGVFLDLVELMPDVKFAICTGHEELKGNDYAAVARVAAMTSKPCNLTVYKGLTKPEYYSVLKASKIQLNTALQDWVSFTLLEALTHGCLPCYPLFRDFATVFAGNPAFTYEPFEREAAINTLTFLLNAAPETLDRQYLAKILARHDESYDLIAKEILNDYAK